MEQKGQFESNKRQVLDNRYASFSLCLSQPERMLSDRLIGLICDNRTTYLPHVRSQQNDTHADHFLYN